MEIIVAGDGEEWSRPPLLFASDLAQSHCIPLVSLFIIDSVWPDFIGNDWQSSRNSRKGFLSYINKTIEEQIEKANRQFASLDYPMARFEVINGDPGLVLPKLAQEKENMAICLSKRIFQACGRPSMKKLASDMLKSSKIPLFIFP